MVELRTLGGLEVVEAGGGHGEPLLSRPKPLALLVYLALAGAHPVRRDTLVGLLWPDLDEQHARRALSQALYGIRKALGREVLRESGQENVSLDPEAVRCDATAFRDARRDGRLSEALTLYGGDFLPGFHLDACHQFDEWVHVRRDELRREAVSVALQLGEIDAEGGSGAGVTRRVRSALEWAPLDEAVLQSALRLLDRVGNRSGALRLYREFSERLRADLDLGPSPETEALVAAIRAREEGEAPVPAAARGAGGAPPTATPPPEPAPMAPTKPAAPASRAPTLMKAGTPLALLAIAVAVWTGRSRPDAENAMAPAVEPDRIVVLPFENLTGDPGLDVIGEHTAQWVTRMLDRSALVPVVSRSSVRDARASLGSEAASARAVADYVAARYVVRGSFVLAGDSVRFSVELLDTPGDELLESLAPLAGPGDSLEAVIGRLADQVAAAVGARLDPDVMAHLAGVSPPPTLEVLELVEAALHLGCSDFPRMLEYLDRGRALAPDYPPLLSGTIAAYVNLGRPAQADSVLRIFEGMQGLTRSERLERDFWKGLVSGDNALRSRAAEELFRIDPALNALWAAGAASDTNHLQRALERIARADFDMPCFRDYPVPWSFLAQLYHRLGRYGEELATARDGLERFPDDRSLKDAEIRAFAGMGQPEAVDSILDVMAALPPQAGWAPRLRPVWAGLELKAHGFDDQAASAFQRGLRRFAEVPPDFSRYNRGRALYFAGRLADADTLFAALLHESPDHVDYLGFHGVTLAALGRHDEAARMDARLEALDTPYLRAANTRWRAAMAAAAGDASTAVPLLQQALSEGQYHEVTYHRSPWWDPIRADPAFRALLEPR